MKKRKLYKLLSAILTACMIAMLLPATAFAKDSDDEKTPEEYAAEAEKALEALSDEELQAIQDWVDNFIEENGGVPEEKDTEEEDSEKTTEAAKADDFDKDSRTVSEAVNVGQRDNLKEDMQVETATVGDGTQASGSDAVTSYTVTFQADGTVVESRTVKSGDTVGAAPKDPTKTGYIFLGWYDAAGAVYAGDKQVLQDLVYVAKFIDETQAVKAKKLFFARSDCAIEIGKIIFSQNYEIVPADAQDKRVSWKSSDETLATVDENGLVTLKQKGVVTITAALANGALSTYNLTIVGDGELPAVDKSTVTIANTQMTLKVDDYDQIKYSVSPVNANTDFLFTSSDESVATVDGYGVVHGIKAGTTTVTIRESVSGLQTTCAVTVESETTPTTTTYSYKSGNGSTWQKGSTIGLTFVVDRANDSANTYSHFRSVEVDNGTLLNLLYTVESGSLKLTLKPEYLQDLTVGTHNISIKFDDGSANTTFTIAAAGTNTNTNNNNTNNNNTNSNTSNNTSVRTGDAAKPIIAILLVFAVFAGFALWIRSAVKGKR